LEFLSWLEATGLSVWIRESLWGYPIVLSSHAVGMAVVVGMVTMIDIRVLGFARKIPISSFNSLFTLTWAGFAVNFISGCLLFTGDPAKFFFSTTFRVKIILIIIGMISVWQLLRAVTDTGESSSKAKTIAVVSLLCWFGAITAGRLTAYL
jgi:hypothetical protein